MSHFCLTNTKITMCLFLITFFLFAICLYQTEGNMPIMRASTSRLSKIYFNNFVNVPENGSAEVASGGFLLERVFLEDSQNSHENTCTRVSF